MGDGPAGGVEGSSEEEVGEGFSVTSLGGERVPEGGEEDGGGGMEVEVVVGVEEEVLELVEVLLGLKSGGFLEGVGVESVTGGGGSFEELGDESVGIDAGSEVIVLCWGQANSNGA